MARIRRILCPVDFFPASLRAADYAIRFAQNYNAKLHLLHVISPVIYSASDYGLTVSHLVDDCEKQAARMMAKLEGKARGVGVTVHTDIRTRKSVRSEIESAIRRTKADVLVMGTHGRQGLEKWFLGSVAERLLRSSPIPVLTLRGTSKRRTTLPAPAKVLVTTDFSAGAARAVKLALSVAQANQARLTLLHVLEELRALTSPTYRQEATERRRDELLKLLPPDAQDSCDIEARIEAGTPYHVILRILKKDKFDFLVMNTHGKGMLDRALLGSTSERVVRAARCPVLLIPPRKKAKSRSRAQRAAA